MWLTGNLGLLMDIRMPIQRKKNLFSFQTTAGVVKWIVILCFMMRRSLPDLKRSVLDLSFAHWAPAHNVAFECSSKMTWNNCWKRHYNMETNVLYIVINDSEMALKGSLASQSPSLVLERIIFYGSGSAPPGSAPPVQELLSALALRSGYWSC